MTSVRVAAWAIHVPGVDPPALLGAAPAGPACAAEEARAHLGRKGLLFKEPATRLALCAVHTALGLRPGQPPPRGTADPDTAVVAASNFGNVETVADLARAVQEGAAISPLAAPNASSNVLASTVAIWFGFAGPNLLVCSGATAGLDAVGLAQLLLRAGRARRVVVVGAEPADPTAQEWQARRAGPPAPLRAAAACVILTRADAAGPVVAPVQPIGAAVEGPPPTEAWLAGADHYGAEGVLRLAVAAARVGTGAVARQQVCCGDPVDGYRLTEVSGEDAGAH